MISVIIPSYKDPLLHKTIDSLIDNADDFVEIVVVLDGYKLKKQLRNEGCIIQMDLKKNVGMREAINIGVAHSTGEYIMRVDEHCMFGKGYDTILTKNIKDNWIVTPRRYKLDVEKWEVMKDMPIDVEKLIISKPRNKFGSVPWRSKNGGPVVETMAMQGSCWLMARTHWNSVIKRLDSEGYGTHYQDSVEMAFKTWQSGGKLMVNKKTWYAHKHRKFKRTHNYGGKLAEASFAYSLGLWKDYYDKVVKPKWGMA